MRRNAGAGDDFGIACVGGRDGLKERQHAISVAHAGISLPANSASCAVYALAWRAFWIAARTRAGVSGVSLTSAPSAAKASRTALAIAAGGATAPPSPIPFMPYSVAEAGVCMCPILIAGNSAAPGRR